MSFDRQSCPHADDVASFVLRTMPDDERAAFATHLETCADCRRDVAAFAPVRDLLPLGVETRSAPPDLKRRIMAEVRAEAELLRASGPEADRVEPPRTRWSWRSALVGAAAAAAVAIVAVVVAIDADEPARVRTIAATVASGPAHAHVEMRDGEATLVVRDLPAARAGRTYAIWTQRGDDAPRLAGTFRPARGAAETRARVAGDAEGLSAVMVTDEPAPAGGAPTAAPIVVARMT